jgi:TDG/mug DNA glycosylase family protein
MLDLVPERAPDAQRVRADLAALPFAPGSLGGAYASKSYVHLSRASVPLALADLHRALEPDATVRLVVFGGDAEHEGWPGDEFGGRLFSRWPRQLLRDVVEGAGFAVDDWTEGDMPIGGEEYCLDLRRTRTLPDTVGPDMRLLVVGLNPSVYSADAGIPFARPGNRFWPAAVAAGLAPQARAPRDALLRHGMGMTDFVKRATRAASELSSDEYRDGVERVARLATWLQPSAVCVVGLAGWRAAVDRRASIGVQPDALGGRPVYLMPNTSGLNAHTQHDGFVEHLRAALALADANQKRSAAGGGKMEA